MVCLCLDGSPAVDLIEGTAQAWLTAITHGRVFDQQRDTPRIRAAFDRLLANATRWPIPRDLIEAMPSPEAQPRIGYDRGIPRTREARCAHLKELLESMGELYNPRIEQPGYEPESSR